MLLLTLVLALTPAPGGPATMRFVNDCGVSRLLNPQTPALRGGQAYEPGCMVQNYGDAWQSLVYVFLSIHSNGIEVYEDYVVVYMLPPRDSIAVQSFTPWVAGPNLWQGFNFTAYTVIVDDEDPSNDTCTMSAMTTSDTVWPIYRRTPPTIDGFLAPTEWNEAYWFDASNIFGWTARPESAEAMHVWAAQDSAYLYLAAALKRGPTLDSGDLVRLLVDENNDGLWAADSSEGEYRMVVNRTGAVDLSYYWHRPDTFAPAGQPVDSAVAAAGTLNGHLCFEARVPLGSLPNQMNVNPDGDTVGLWLCGVDDGAARGWWRAGLPDSLWRSPADYGKCRLRVLWSGDVDVFRIPSPAAVVDTWEVVTPSAELRYYGGSSARLRAYMFLTNPAGTRVYAEYVDTIIGGGVIIEFPPYNVGTDTGNWVARCSLRVVGDINPANDILDKDFVVTANPGGLAAEPAGSGALVQLGASLAAGRNRSLQLLTAAAASLSVYDIFGRVALARAVPAGSHRIDLRGLSPGVYVVKVAGTGAGIARKVVIE